MQYLHCGRSSASQIVCKLELFVHMVYAAGSPVEIQITAQWNLISHSMNALPPMSSPRNLCSPSLSHCAFIPARKNVPHALKKKPRKNKICDSGKEKHSKTK